MAATFSTMSTFGSLAANGLISDKKFSASYGKLSQFSSLASISSCTISGRWKKLDLQKRCNTRVCVMAKELYFNKDGSAIKKFQIENEFGPPEYDQGEPTKMASTLPIALNVDISAWIALNDQNARYRQNLISTPNAHGFKSQKKYGRCS